MTTAKERQAKGFCESFLVRHQRLFISCHQILESVPQKEQLNALGLKGMWQRKSTTSACWFLVQGTLFLGPAWPSKSWAERCATVKSANGDRQNHDNEPFPILSVFETETSSESRAYNILSDFVLLSTFDGSSPQPRVRGWMTMVAHLPAL